MIRKAERADIPECVRVIRTSFRTVADELGVTEENAPRFTAFATTEERLLWQMYGEHRLMAVDEEDGAVIGYCSVLFGGGECELGNLAVLPGYRHRGIGKKLLDYAVAAAREQFCTVMKLGIVEENTVLRAWYERCGAVHTGCVKYDFFPFTCGNMEIRLEYEEDPGKTAVQFAKRSREILGENLAGIYLHGSAAMGCFHPRKSDLDLLAVVQHPLDDTCKRAYMEMVTELSAQMPGNGTHGGIEMSIVLREVCNPFVYPTPFELHFSAGHLAWYRREPEDYIRKMKGTDKDLAAHFTVIRNRGICLYGLPAAEVFGEVPAADYLDSIREDIAGAREEIAGNPLYLTLNLARVLAYCSEGKVLSKREGGEWALANVPEGFHPLLRTALADYAGSTAETYDPEMAKEYAGYMLDRIGEKENIAQ